MILIRSSLAILLFSSTLVGCMTEADKAIWMEAKLRFNGNGDAIAQEPAIPPVGPTAENPALKTSQDVPAAPIKAAPKKDVMAPQKNQSN